MRIWRIFLGVSFLVALGCGVQPGSTPAKHSPLAAQAEKADQAKGAGGKAGDEPALTAPLARKIIYNATADLLVDNLATAEQQLDEVIKAHKGLLARSEISTAPGTPRTGRWTVRVPEDEFATFMKAIAKLGELQKSKTDSDDVTDEFYDLEGRIKNLKAEEETLRKLLKEAVTMQDRLAIRDQLQRVTSDTERLEGKLKRLDNLSSLSTVIVNISERKDYVPAEEPSLGTSIVRTFRGSLTLLGSFGKAVVLTGVALAPWLPVVVLIALPAGFLIRRRRRLRAQGPQHPPEPPPTFTPMTPEASA
jgi:hypothetical protein